MNKNLLLFCIVFLLLGFSQTAFGQSILVQRTIAFTDSIVDEDEGVSLAVSTDDAEQENDEMDSLTDDDIDTGWEGDAEDQNILTAGLRFQNIGIPQGATIDSAFIVVFSHEGKSPEDVANITIVCEATDSAETFTLDALITDRAQTEDSVLWVVDEEWFIWEPYRTPDLSNIVQEVVDREGWKFGNPLSFILKGENQGPSEVENAREFESYENIADPEDGGDGVNHPERIPQLLIYYSMDSGMVDIPIQRTDTIIDEDEGVQLVVSSDDAEQENDEMDSLTDDDIDTGWEGDAEDQNILTAGLRFQNIPIPQGSTIDSAYILVFSHEGKSTEDVARITIVGEAADNPQTYTLDALITDRPATETSVLWEVAEEWEIWQPYRTADISSIVQELVDREGWMPGNAMAFMLLGEDQGPSEVENAREFESYENIADPEDGGDGVNHPERIPRLIVHFSSGTATSLFDNINKAYNALKVYPNPLKGGDLTLELASPRAASIKLYNQNGQLIQTHQSTGGQQIMLSTGDLVNGIYFLHTVQDDTLYTQKVLIRK